MDNRYKKVIFAFLSMLISNFGYAQSYLYGDSTYNHGIGAPAGIYTMQMESNGSVIVGGFFSNFNNNSNYNYITKLLSDGTPDATYNANLATVSSAVTALKLQPDGKLLVGGYFSTFNSSDCNRMLRLNTDGTRDITFTIDTLLKNPVSPYAGFISRINDIEISGSDIYIGGEFSFIKSGVYYFRGISKINSVGKLDTVSFNVGKGVESGEVFDIELQSDGKVLIAGSITLFDGTTKNSILRLNQDGSIDNSFSSGTGIGSVSDKIYKVKALSNGKILIGGYFSSYNGTAVNGFARLNADGSIDNTFNMGSGFSNSNSTNITIREIKETANNQLLVSGAFSNYNGSSVNDLVRLNSDGSLDADFHTMQNFSGGIFQFDFQGTDKLVIAGTFLYVYYDQSNQSYYTGGVTRLDIKSIPTDLRSKTTSKILLAYPSPSNGSFEISLPEGEYPKEIVITNAMGQKEIIKNSTFVETNLSGILHISVKTTKDLYEGKVMIE